CRSGTTRHRSLTGLWTPLLHSNTSLQEYLNHSVKGTAVRLSRLLFSVLGLAGAATLAHAQVPGRMVVPYPPGGALDAMARVMAERLSDATGRRFVVENRTGAAGAIGSASLKGGPTDGSLLLFAPDSNI